MLVTAINHEISNLYCYFGTASIPNFEYNVADVIPLLIDFFSYCYWIDTCLSLQARAATCEIPGS